MTDKIRTNYYQGIYVRRPRPWTREAQLGLVWVTLPNPDVKLVRKVLADAPEESKLLEVAFTKRGLTITLQEG